LNVMSCLLICDHLTSNDARYQQMWYNLFELNEEENENERPCTN
jgi:hypothetical protein